jgi:protein ImuB
MLWACLRFSDLGAVATDASAASRRLRSLAAWAYRYSSQVAIADPDTLLIEVGASLSLFGGWPVLQRRLRRELAGFGHAPALAVAPVSAAARVLARRHDGFFTDQYAPMRTALGATPIAQSGLDAKAITLLHNVGLRTLREVFPLPRAELARRIGPAALVALDRLRGDGAEILDLYRPPERFAHRIEFDHRIEAWPPLLFPLRRLCGELSLFLTARDGGVQRCELVLEHEDCAATRIPVELLTPQRDAHTLYELARGRLERASLAAPVSGLALIARDLPPLCPRHKDLFESKREQQLDWPQLAERLRAHLGDESVRQLAIVAEHRPERAWSFVTSKKTLSDLRARPLWLLTHALPLRGPPPEILAGPERIESGWWDGDDARRDYYVVLTREGQRAWAYLPAGGREGWMLHGWFA